MDGWTMERMKDEQEGKRMWKPEEDMLLKRYVESHGEGNWSAVSTKLGLRRGGKSCRLRWKNYLRPDIVHGGMSKDEEDLIIRMHKLIGNRWSLIAGRLPGRTDNEVKNYWNTYLSKKVSITNKRGAKRKPMASETERVDESHEDDKKRAKTEQGHNHGEVSPNTIMVEEKSVVNPGEEFVTGDELLVGPGSDVASPSCGIMGMQFGGGDDGNPFIIFDQQLEEPFGAAFWDHRSCVLFDAFGAPFLI